MTTGWLISFETNVWYFPPLSNYWFIESHKLLAKIIGHDEAFLCNAQRKRMKKSGVYYHKAGLQETQEWYKKLFLSGKLMKIYEKWYSKLQKEHEKLINRYFDNESVRLKEMAAVAVMGGAVHFITQPHHLELIEESLEEIRNRNNIQQADFLKLLEHDELIGPQRLRKALMQLVIKKHGNTLKTQDLEKFRKDFCFAYVIKKTMNEDREVIISQQEVQDIISKHAEETSSQMAHEEIRKIMQSLRKITQQKKQLVKKYNLSQEESRMLSDYAKLAHYRLEGRNMWIVHYVIIGKYKRETLHKNGLHENAFDACTFEQYCQGVEGDFIPRAGNMPQNICVFKENNQYSIYYDKAARDRIQHFQIPFDDEIPNLIKGQVTYKNGIIKGVARVIKWDKHFEKEMQKMKEDEILIVDQTKPDLMDAIRKAKGIITNEGGLISHAAIISRELKIPCIIQTKYATKAFETGDKIVMNTNTGEVKKE